MNESHGPPLYSWMRPAWWFGRVRPGLRSATVADAARLRDLPPLLGSVILPLLAVLIPTLLSLGHATTTAYFKDSNVVSPSTLIIYDVFTESVPFMIAAGIVGLIAPAAGALLAIVYAVTDLAVTTWSGELVPVVGATYGRLVTYLVLWLLVVEIPLMARAVFEWWSRRNDAPRSKRTAAVVAAGLVATGLIWIWVLSAPLMIAVVFQTPGWRGSPPYTPFVAMAEHGGLVLIGLGLAVFPLLALRYFGASAHVGGDADEPAAPSGRREQVAYFGSLALTLMMLSTVIRTPVDAAILIAGLLAARPIARLFLRATGFAPVLAAIARPIRLVAGFGVVLGFAWVFVAIVGPSTTTPFFHMVIAIAAGFVLLEVFLAADDVVAAAPPTSPPLQGSVGKALALGALLCLAIPAVAFADDMANELDILGMANAAAASAAAAKAFETALRKKYPNTGGRPSGGGSRDGGTPKDSPPPWWQPDGWSDAKKSLGL